MAAPTLRLRGGDPPRTHSAPSGYSMTPRSVTERPNLSDHAHRVFTALCGLSWADTRQTAASIGRIAEACGKPRRSIQRALTELIDAGLISRRPDPEHPGGPWITFILADPRGFALDDTPRQNWRVVAPKLARGSAKNGAAPLYSQPVLTLEQPADGSVEPPKPKPPGTYVNPLNPGLPPPGCTWSYSQGNPKPGARPVAVPVGRRAAEKDPDDPDGSKLKAAIEEMRSRLPRAAQKNPAVERPSKAPPRPAGDQIPSPVRRPETEHTVNVCSGQESAGSTEFSQHPRPDSNRPASAPASAGTGPADGRGQSEQERSE